ncbi:MAG: hypothetical protein QXX12_06040 [Nanopusillaceae archaeon]
MASESVDREYVFTPVPLADRFSLIAITMLWASLTLDPSAPYLASWWGVSFPFATFVAGVLLANLVLSLFSSLSGYMASREGLTYALAAERVYGSRGVIVPSLWAGIVCVGWLAFSIGVVAEGIVFMLKLPYIAYYISVILMTLLFSITAYLGVRHIIKLAYVGVPLLVILIIAGIVLSVSKWGAPSMGTLDMSALPILFGLVLGTFVNGSIVLSFDYQRFCRKPVHAVSLAFLNFLGFWSFIILLTGIPAAVAGMNFYSAYEALGLLPLSIITLFLLAWTSADNQLYSASLSWSLSIRFIGRTVNRKRVVVVATLLTTVLALIKLHTFAIQWLSLLTSISLPAGIVLWTEYYIKSRMKLSEGIESWNPYAFISWIIGSLTIYHLYVVKKLWYGLLVGFLITSIVYVVIRRR